MSAGRNVSTGLGIMQILFFIVWVALLVMIALTVGGAAILIWAVAQVVVRARHRSGSTRRQPAPGQAVAAAFIAVVSIVPVYFSVVGLVTLPVSVLSLILAIVGFRRDDGRYPWDDRFEKATLVLAAFMTLFSIVALL